MSAERLEQLVEKADALLKRASAFSNTPYSIDSGCEACRLTSLVFWVLCKPRDLAVSVIALEQVDCKASKAILVRSGLEFFCVLNRVGNQLKHSAQFSDVLQILPEFKDWIGKFALDEQGKLAKTTNVITHLKKWCSERCKGNEADCSCVKTYDFLSDITHPGFLGNVTSFPKKYLPDSCQEGLAVLDDAPGYFEPILLCSITLAEQIILLMENDEADILAPHF